MASRCIQTMLKLLTCIACLLCAKHGALCFMYTCSKHYNEPEKQVLYSQRTVQDSATCHSLSSHANEFSLMPSYHSIKTAFSDIAYNLHVSRSCNYSLEFSFWNLSSQVDHTSTKKHSTLCFLSITLLLSSDLLPPLSPLAQDPQRLWKEVLGPGCWVHTLCSSTY